MFNGKVRVWSVCCDIVSQAVQGSGVIVDSIVPDYFDFAVCKP